jgi:hypothetical protein
VYSNTQNVLNLTNEIADAVKKIDRKNVRVLWHEAEHLRHRLTRSTSPRQPSRCRGWRARRCVSSSCAGTSRADRHGEATSPT